MESTFKKRAGSEQKYERFGEVVRYLNRDELRVLFDAIDNYTHKLMFEVIFELGCRVGEFVRIQVKHLNFGRSTVYFPAENTKTKHARTSYLPPGLMNELISMLKQKKIISKRGGKIYKADAYVFHHGICWNTHYTENRIRQIFQKYVQKAGLHQVYGKDTKGRNLKVFTVHSLRHAHLHTNVIDYGIPLPIVQRQVGHVSLKTTSVYLHPQAETIAQAYQAAREKDKSADGKYRKLNFLPEKVDHH